jgi:hypothetical protein
LNESLGQSVVILLMNEAAGYDIFHNLAHGVSRRAYGRLVLGHSFDVGETKWLTDAWHRKNSS